MCVANRMRINVAKKHTTVSHQAIPKPFAPCETTVFWFKVTPPTTGRSEKKSVLRNSRGPFFLSRGSHHTQNGFGRRPAGGFQRVKLIVEEGQVLKRKLYIFFIVSVVESFEVF